MPPSKRKREKEDDDGKEPKAPRISGRQRKKRSFGEDFEENWSPPRGTENPTPQQPKHTKHKPGASTSTEDPEPEPGSSQVTVTWPSNEKYRKQLLPHNYRKCLYFSRKWWYFCGKRFS